MPPAAALEDGATANLDEHRTGRWRSIRVWVLAALVYGVLSVIVTKGVWRAPQDRWIGAEGDPKAFMWWIDWMPHALSNGLNPLRPTVLQHPLGANALWNTSILLPSLVLIPVTLLFGSIVTWNLIIAGAPVLSALVAMVAIRRFVDRPFPAFVGGLVYGFSPYMIVKMDGHPNLLIGVFPPLALLCLHELFVRQKRSPIVIGILFGLAATAQLLTGSEVLLTTALACGVTAVTVAAVYGRRFTHRWQAGAKGLAVAAVVALATSAPFLGYQFFGPREAGCCLPGLENYVLDAETLFVPSYYQHFRTQGTMEIASNWRAFNESNGYIGVPLMAVLVVGVFALRRRPEVVVSAVVAGTLIVLALGSSVDVGGTSTGIAMPWRLLRYVWLLGDVITARLVLFVYLAIGVMLAASIEVLLARRSSSQRNLALAAVGIALVSLTPTPVAVRADDTPPFFRDEAALERLVPQHAVAMASPYYESDAMQWQAASGFHFRLIQGSVILPGPTSNGPVTPLTELFNALGTIPPGPLAPLTRSERRAYTDELDGLEVDVILVGPSVGRENVERFTEALVGSAGTRSGDVTVFVRPGRGDE